MTNEELGKLAAAIGQFGLKVLPVLYLISPILLIFIKQ